MEKRIEIKVEYGYEEQMITPNGDGTGTLINLRRNVDTKTTVLGCVLNDCGKPKLTLRIEWDKGSREASGLVYSNELKGVELANAINEVLSSKKSSAYDASEDIAEVEKIKREREEAEYIKLGDNPRKAISDLLYQAHNRENANDDDNTRDAIDLRSKAQRMYKLWAEKNPEAYKVEKDEKAKLEKNHEEYIDKTHGSAIQAKLELRD